MSYSDEEYVKMNISNEQTTYNEFMSIVHDLPWWDSSDSTWNDVDKAGNQLKSYVIMIKSMKLDGFSDLEKIDLDNVDWESIIQDELDEIDTSELD